MKLQKRQLKKILSNCVDESIDCAALQIILDANNNEYYLRRAIECISEAIDASSVENETAKAICLYQLDKAILLLAITEARINGT